MAGWRSAVLTLFPHIFPGPLASSVVGRGLREGVWHLDICDIKAHSPAGHHGVDDKPYGGGAGMVMRADVIDRCVSSVYGTGDTRPLIYMSARGKPLTQASMGRYAAGDGVVILCGHYEGVDQRVIEHWHMEEVCIGDYVLSGGEIAAMVLLDGCVRLLSGVVGDKRSVQEESFAHGLLGRLEYPHYTTPPSWRGYDVPSVLLSGDHGRIARWRHDKVQEVTVQRRPEMDIDGVLEGAGAGKKDLQKKEKSL
ncbi:MAG: tRNA (guanosine(37)-N1)-methyltransferase TrmD [Alphaproteobacteria bacterium GM7ARS4]|nr:tRNA (guanosine(37)-N1)-methyltransferase TrmD [Alphaproteobacteria bacterium GM7ARS4]